MIASDDHDDVHSQVTFGKADWSLGRMGAKESGDST